MPGGDTYKAYLQDTNKNMVASAFGRIANNGTFENYIAGALDFVEPGFTFTFKLYDSSGTILQHTYATKFPHFGISSINPATKIVMGTAPAKSQLDISLDHTNEDATESEIYTEVTATASGAGVWKANFGKAIMTGGDEVDVSGSEASSVFVFGSYLIAPYIECVTGYFYCASQGSPAAPASLFIKHSGELYRFNGKFDDTNGLFFAGLYDQYHAPIFLAAGDQVGGTGVQTLTLPSLTGTPDPASDSITGSAPASSWIDVDVRDITGAERDCDDWVEATAGTYIADCTGQLSMTSSDMLIISVSYVDPITGNMTDYMSFIAP